MAARWEALLARWQSAGLIDEQAAARIRTFESQHIDGQRLRWPTILAIAIGGLMLGAGVLLFVAAHWDKLSPGERFAMVLLLVGVFHLGGVAVETQFPALATVLHAVGTASLGAGIFLAAQIFNLNEDWTNGVLLWTIGAAIGWFLLRDWVQGSFVALLFPVWLAGKWANFARGSPHSERVIAEGLLMLAIVYLTARMASDAPPMRRALQWIGAIWLLPCVAVVLSVNDIENVLWGQTRVLPVGQQVIGWSVAILVPLALAWILRGSAAWMNAAACIWVVVLGTMHYRDEAYTGNAMSYFYNEIGPFLWCLVGSIGLIGWGLSEARKERVNLGLAGIGLTILWFYLSNVMDKLGRSESLIGFGLVFLLVGWLFERARKTLSARMAGRAP